MAAIILFVLVFCLLLDKFRRPESPPIVLAITSVVMVGIAIYILHSHGSSPHDKNWAYVCVGIASGLWLRNSRQLL